MAISCLRSPAVDSSKPACETRGMMPTTMRVSLAIAAILASTCSTERPVDAPEEPEARGAHPEDGTSERNEPGATITADGGTTSGRNERGVISAAEFLQGQGTQLARYQEPREDLVRVAGRLRDVSSLYAEPDTAWIAVDGIEGLEDHELLTASIRNPAPETDAALERIGRDGRIALDGLARNTPGNIGAVLHMHEVRRINEHVVPASRLQAIPRAKTGTGIQSIPRRTPDNTGWIGRRPVDGRAVIRRRHARRRGAPTARSRSSRRFVIVVQPLQVDAHVVDLGVHVVDPPRLPISLPAPANPDVHLEEAELALHWLRFDAVDQRQDPSRSAAGRPFALRRAFISKGHRTGVDEVHHRNSTSSRRRHVRALGGTNQQGATVGCASGPDLDGLAPARDQVRERLPHRKSLQDSASGDRPLQPLPQFWRNGDRVLVRHGRES